LQPGAALPPSVTLTSSHRCAPAVTRVVSGIARRLPGGCEIDGTGTDAGSVMAKLAASAGADAWQNGPAAAGTRSS